MGVPTQVSLQERELVGFVLEYLFKRGFHEAARALERDSGVHALPLGEALAEAGAGAASHQHAQHRQALQHVAFLRGCVLDGKWAKAVAFVDPLQNRCSPQNFRRARFALRKQQFLELLTFDPKEGTHPLDQHTTPLPELSSAIQQSTTACLSELQADAPAREDFLSVCYLLTLDSPTKHPDLQGWSVHTGRQHVLDTVGPIVCDALGCPQLASLLHQGVEKTTGTELSDRSGAGEARQARLVELVTQGLARQAAATPRKVTLEWQPLQHHSAGGGDDESSSATSLGDGDGDGTEVAQNGLAGVETALLNGQRARHLQHGHVTEEFGAHLGNGDVGGRGPRMSWDADPARASRPATATITSSQTPHQPQQHHGNPQPQRRSRDPTPEPPGSPSTDRFMADARQRELLRSDPNRAAAIEVHYGYHTASPPPDVEPLNRTAAMHPDRVPLSSSRGMSSRPTTAAQRPTSAGQPHSGVNEGGGGSRPQSRGQEYPGEASASVPSSPLPRGQVVSTPEDCSTISASLCAQLQDTQAIRAAAFHPDGSLVAVGSNSYTLRVCASHLLSQPDAAAPPTQLSVLFQKKKYHRGSIYCVKWNDPGNIIATGSNDKLVRLLGFDAAACAEVGQMDLRPDCGTVRDLCFSNNLIACAGGAAGVDSRVCVLDLATGKTLHRLVGHHDCVTSVRSHQDLVVSSSMDGSVRFWDVRQGSCVKMFNPSVQGCTAADLSSSGNMVAVGFESGGALVYDVTANRAVHSLQPHSSDCRSVSFTNDGHYVLSSSYDGSIVLSHVHGNAVWSTIVAEHYDKVIQSRWHPHTASFASTSADHTVCLWSLNL